MSLLNRIPFYYLFKTTFLLYLALPQTQGSTYIYTRHLYPFLQAHETEIDQRVVEAKSRLFEWVRIRLRSIWERFGGVIPSNTTHTASSGSSDVPPVDTPPTLLAPMTNPLQLALGLWRTYSPAIGAFLQQPAASPVASSSSPRQETYISLSSQPRRSSAVEIHPPIDAKLLNREALLNRRRALEAELAALNSMSNLEPAEISTFTAGQSATTSDTSTSVSTFAATLASTAVTAMSTYLPTSSALDDRGRYEEIARDELEADDDDPRATQYSGRTSWWWNSSNRGYERLKTE